MTDDFRNQQSETSHRIVSKYGKRLATLEKKLLDLKEDKINLEQNDHFRSAEDISSDLKLSWSQDDRIQALKSAIQLSKLLSDSSNPAAYPVLYSQATNTLDFFGALVYLRVKDICEENDSDHTLAAPGKRSNNKNRVPLKTDFSYLDVPPIAADTANNWFHKISCIRELLPRIYIEIALLQSYQFLLDLNGIMDTISRIGDSIKGVGDLLVSCFLRSYLVSTCITVLTTGFHQTHIPSNFLFSLIPDILYCISEFQQLAEISDLQDSGINKQISPSVSKTLQKRLVTLLPVITPVIEGVFSAVAHSATKSMAESVLLMYRKHCGLGSVLKCILHSFDASLYTDSILDVIQLIQEAKCFEDSAVQPCHLFCVLGHQLMSRPPPVAQRIEILNAVWSAIAQVSEVDQFIHVSAVWLHVVLRHYSRREVQLLLKEIATHISETCAGTADLLVSDTALSAVRNVLLALVQAELGGKGSAVPEVDGGCLLRLGTFSPLLDLFPTEARVDICQEILSTLKYVAPITDTALLSVLIDIGKILHDAVDRLSSLEDVINYSILIVNLVNKVDCGSDLELELSFYVDCRAVYSKLDRVQEALIYKVSKLIMKTRSMRKGFHSRKSASFVKSCLAYCHITIPSIKCTFTKLKLLTYSAQLSLLNQCLPQCDTFLKSAMSLLPEAPVGMDVTLGVSRTRVNAEQRLMEATRNILSLLLVVPGRPDIGPFYLVEGLLNAIGLYSWSKTSGALLSLHVDVLNLLLVMGRRKFPYRVPLVDSNDVLYGGSVDYRSRLQSLMEKVITSILDQINSATSDCESAGKLGGSAVTGQAMKAMRTSLEVASALASRSEEEGAALICTSEIIDKFLAIAAPYGTTGEGCKHWGTVTRLISRRSESTSSLS